MLTVREVPFVETIGEEEKDPLLPDKLQAEADGIMAWVVAGAVRWHKEGLGCPAEVDEATKAYRAEMDSIGAFIDECCEIGERLTATARDLYAAYGRWCDDFGEKPMSQKRLGTELSNRSMVSDRDGYTGRKVWRGIGLKASAPEASRKPNEPQRG